MRFYENTAPKEFRLLLITKQYSLVDGAMGEDAKAYRCTVEGATIHLRGALSARIARLPGTVD